MTKPLMLPQERGLPQVLALCLAHTGDSYVWIALIAAAWFLGDGRWKERALLAFAGLALAQIVVVIVKMFIRRPRPEGTGGKIYRKLDPYSFPSGHAARAAILSILALAMGPAAAFIAIIAWSPFMILSRIAIGIHYVLDVVAGLLLGAGLTVVLLQAAALIPHRF
jgi:undecaprenyl-diphosphatase